VDHPGPSLVASNEVLLLGQLAGSDPNNTWAVTIVEARLRQDWDLTKSVFMNISNTTLWSSQLLLIGARQAIAEAPLLAATQPLAVEENRDTNYVDEFRAYYDPTKQKKKKKKKRSVAGPVAGSLTGFAVCGVTLPLSNPLCPNPSFLVFKGMDPRWKASSVTALILTSVCTPHL
jgi:hypothetical protein